MLIISACLCGIDCTYNGKNNRNPIFEELLRSGQALPVCPEQLGGLETPRTAAEIIGGAGQEVLAGQARVMTRQGTEVSAKYIRGAEQTLKIAQTVDPELVVFKSRSPACGVGAIYDGNFSSRLKEGDGVAAALLKRHGFKIVDNETYISRLRQNC